MAGERIDKILSHSGFGTRKDVKKLLHQNAVTLDGVAVTDASLHVDTSKQCITVHGKDINVQKHIYLMLNKPAGTVSATKDANHTTVFDLLDKSLNHKFLGGALHLVGRLDIDTEGLILLTTDGELTHRLTSPKTHCSKTYFVRLERAVQNAEQQKITKAFADGLNVPREHGEDAFVAQSAHLTWLNECEVELVIYEGKYHQVKRMFSAVDNKVVYLKRIAMGDVKLDATLLLGAYRALNKDELFALGIE